MKSKWIKIFLRIALAAGFLSAVADRVGLWPEDMVAWGNWTSFLDYTQTLIPWVPSDIIPTLGLLATVAEAAFGICLLIGFYTKLVAQLSGWLLLIFALTMAFSLGVKAPLDYSVFAASAAAFALSVIDGKYLEIDQILKHG